MVLTVIDEFGKLLADGLDVVETGQCHIAVEVGSGGSWVNGENFHRRFRLLKWRSGRPYWQRRLTDASRD